MALELNYVVLLPLLFFGAQAMVTAAGLWAGWGGRAGLLQMGKVRGSTQLQLPLFCCRLCSRVCPTGGAAVTVLSGLLPCTQKYRASHAENLLLPTFVSQGREAEANTPHSEMRGQMLLARVICPSTTSLLTARTQAGSSCLWIPSSLRN